MQIRYGRENELEEKCCLTYLKGFFNFLQQLPSIRPFLSRPSEITLVKFLSLAAEEMFCKTHFKLDSSKIKKTAYLWAVG